MNLEQYNPFNNSIFSVLDETGNANKAVEPDIDEDELVRLYRYMVLARLMDDKSFMLQREGRLGTYAQSKGQEAAQIGSVCCLRNDDWFFPLYRDSGGMLVKGVPPHLLFLYWMGSEEGNRFPKGINVFPIAIPVGSQISLGTGFSWAAKLKKKNIVTLVSFGDGASSEGDFHDGMNFAGVYSTPTVFLCQNNQYAISVPTDKQTASRTFAQKASAYGFLGIKVDGNDVLAMCAATREAIRKARKGHGPTLIEAYTYRLADHTTADDSRRYRSDEEVKEWEKKDPIIRFKKYLETTNILTPSKDEEIKKGCLQILDAAVKEAEQFEGESYDQIFKYTYKEMTKQQGEQLGELEESLPIESNTNK